MKVLVVGAAGFIGKNLVLRLQELGHEVFMFDKNNSLNDLATITDEVSFIYHLGGINRAGSDEEFVTGNVDLTSAVVKMASQKNLPVLYSSTTKIETEPYLVYSITKLQGEKIVKKLGKNGHIICLPNVFGKWAQPFYNSVVATFIEQVYQDQVMVTHDAKLTLAYIDDVTEVLLSYLGPKVLPLVTYEKTVPEIASLLRFFKKELTTFTFSRKDDFETKLFATFLSAIPKSDLFHPLNVHLDERGSFTELIKSEHQMQVSLNVINPGFTKGNHYHHTKIEIFTCIDGEAEVTLKHLGNGDEFMIVLNSLHRTVFIPPGYLHQISNKQAQEFKMLIYSFSFFDPEHSDTYQEMK
ncbi:MAG: NAD-dependent epimerase/dehydratase family protein [Erysipelotrichaceae bacterium]|jgi:UDP-2-acetamido-2,6-beta-L-arabino-hexul-4-ose reductase|nr:NAD-dependent epimerase/dehydratase family protein [Erysipelotrichaceae bacterium]